MSSTYYVLCLSHDPAITVNDPGYNQPEAAEQAIRDRPAGHENCDLMIGRHSGAFVELGCPAARDQLRPGTLRCYHGVTAWVDTKWTLLLAAAYQTTDRAVRDAVKTHHHRCLPWERLRRLRDELGFPLAPQPVAGAAGSADHSGAYAWHKREDGALGLDVPGGLVTVPGHTSEALLLRFAESFLGPATYAAGEQ